MAIELTAPRPVQFSIGRVIRDSFWVFGRNFVSFSILAIGFRLLWLPVPTIHFVDAGQVVSQRIWPVQMVQLLVGLLIGALTQAGVTFGTLQTLRGRRASFGDALHGLRFTIPILVASAIVSLPSMALTAVQGMFASSHSAAFAQMALGIAVLVILVFWWVFAPVIIIERAGVWASLTRSAYLTKGRRWRIAGLLTILGTMGMAVIFVISKFGNLTALEMASESAFTPDGAMVFVVTALFSAFHPVLIAVAYYRLRSDKEGFDLEEIVRIFE